MSINIEVVPTLREIITPGRLDRAWSARSPNVALAVTRLQDGALMPVDDRLALDHYVLEFSDGIGMGFSVDDNIALGRDEESELAEFGEPDPDLIATWKAIGHTFTLTLSGAYGMPAVRRMEQVAGLIAGLVQGHVMVLDPWYSRPRGLYAPGTFP